MERLQSHVGYNKRLVVERRQARCLRHLARIPELDYVPSGSYVEATEEQVLAARKRGGPRPAPTSATRARARPSTPSTPPKVEVVARVNSGENAATPSSGENASSTTYCMCPSGLLTPGKVNVVGPECVMDPSPSCSVRSRGASNPHPKPSLT